MGTVVIPVSEPDGVKRNKIRIHGRYWLYGDQEGGRVLIDVFTEQCCCECRNIAPLLIANKHGHC
jgi:hypothetical protein